MSEQDFEEHLKSRLPLLKSQLAYHRDQLEVFDMSIDVADLDALISEMERAEQERKLAVSFHKLAVSQRDLAWEEGRRLTKERDALRSMCEELAGALKEVMPSDLELFVGRNRKGDNDMKHVRFSNAEDALSRWEKLKEAGNVGS